MEAATPPAPAEVIVGACINDIHELDFRSHSYAVDLYVWLRWKYSESNPEKSLEFMNRFAPNDHVRESLVRTSWVTAGGADEAQVARGDRKWALGLGLLYLLAVAVVTLWSVTH